MGQEGELEIVTEKRPAEDGMMWVGMVGVVDEGELD
jgi:hypothetical protein